MNNVINSFKPVMNSTENNEAINLKENFAEPIHQPIQKPTFTSIDLWHIQRNSRTAFSKRSSLLQ